MTLNDQQVRQFETEGWLFLPDAFSAEEVAVLRTEADAIFRTDRKEIWREKSGAPRTAFAAHTYNEGFRLLGAHPRLIRPVEQLFGEKLYNYGYWNLLYRALSPEAFAFMRDACGYEANVANAEAAVGAKLLWRVPNQYFAVSSAIDRGTPVMEQRSSEMARCFAGLAHELTREDAHAKREAWKLFKSI